MTLSIIRGWRLAFILVILSVFGLFTYNQVNAQDNNTDSGSGLSISPIRFEEELAPGELATITMTVKNITSNELDIVNTVKDFAPDPEEGGGPKLVEPAEGETLPYSIKPFIQPLERFPLGPGEEKEVSFVVQAPDNAAPGGYFGALQFGALPPGSDDTVVALQSSVAPIVFIRVPGDVVQSMNIEQLGASSGGNIGKFFQSVPEHISVRIKNSGNIFEAPFGRVVVKNWRGNEVMSYELNPVLDDQGRRAYVLPQSVRRFDQAAENIGSFGRYKVQAELAYGDGGGQIITGEATFWVIPWKTVILAIVIISGLVFILVRGIKAYNKQVVKKAKGEKSSK